MHNNLFSGNPLPSFPLPDGTSVPITTANVNTLWGNPYHPATTYNNTGSLFDTSSSDLDEEEDDTPDYKTDVEYPPEVMSPDEYREWRDKHCEDDTEGFGSIERNSIAFRLGLPAHECLHIYVNRSDTGTWCITIADKKCYRMKLYYESYYDLAREWYFGVFPRAWENELENMLYDSLCF